MKEILRLEHIQKFYGNQGNLTKAINDISFSVNNGEFVGIMGASGSGKTTLLNCISTIDTVSAGHIYLDGADVTEIKEKDLARFRRENLGFVFQDFNLLDTLTISENIALALTINKAPQEQIEGKVREMAGFEPVPLADNAFFMHLDYEMDMESIAGGIDTKKIQLDDGTFLALADTPVYNEPLGKYMFNNDGSVLVFPDKVCDNLHLARTCYYANTETAISYHLCDIIRDEIAEAFQNRYEYLFTKYEAKYDTDKHYASFLDPIRFRTQEKNDVVLTATSVRLMGIYSGIIFFIICMTVLALQETADSIDHRAQYRTLHQIGVDREDIVKMVSRQSLYYFFTPCVIAFLFAMLLIYSFVVRYGHKVSTYIGSTGFRFGVMIPGLLIVLILVCYYGATIYMVKRNLNRALNDIR